MYMFAFTAIQKFRMTPLLNTHLKKFFPPIPVPAAYPCLFSLVLGPLDPEAIVKAEVQLPLNLR